MPSNSTKQFTKKEINEINEGAYYVQFYSLEHFFILTGINYKNLHEHLNITSTYLTQLKNNPVKKGTMSLAKDISNLTGIHASILIRLFSFGYDNITLSSMEELEREERVAYNNLPEAD